MSAATSTDLLLGIDFGGTKMALAIADLEGRILARRRIATEPDRGAHRALSRALATAEVMAADVSGRIVAAGVATPGVVRDNGIDLAPNVPGWGELRLADAVAARFGDLPVTVWNDVNAAALAELRVGALIDRDPGLVIGIGTGVATAVTVSGSVVTGHHGAAGEIGYGLIGAGALAPGEATLESVFAGRAFDLLARRWDLIGAAELTTRDAPDDVTREVEWRIDTMARQVIGMCLLLDPERVVMFGGLARDERIIDRLTGALRRSLPFPTEVVVSEFVDDAPLVGALTLAADSVCVVVPRI